MENKEKCSEMESTAALTGVGGFWWRWLCSESNCGVDSFCGGFFLLLFDEYRNTLWKCFSFFFYLYFFLWHFYIIFQTVRSRKFQATKETIWKCNNIYFSIWNYWQSLFSCKRILNGCFRYFIVFSNRFPEPHFIPLSFP